MEDLDRNLFCIRPACGDRLPEFTAGGRKKSAFRLKEQKYCCPACARLHYFEQLHEEEARVAAGEAILNKFIYGGYRAQNPEELTAR